MKPIISVEGLGKKYLIKHKDGRGVYRSLREEIFQLPKKIFTRREVNEEFWALKDVFFDIMPGDRVGIIGRNGAGKSTLLKLLSRITEPSSGKVTMRGRVASLLEVGTGFHPELTGRENIFLNGAVLGMTRAEVRKKFDEIVDFAGVEKFLDTPVKRYSSGMYVRLAFAVAAHLEPEILVVDEVLAVGDTEFQKKCLGKMEEVGKSEGRTVLFVSHNMGAIQQLCSKGLFLTSGELSFSGDITGCLEAYENSIAPTLTSQKLGEVERTHTGSNDAKILSCSFRNVGNDISDVIDSDLPCIFEVTFEVLVDELNVGADFFIVSGYEKTLFFQSLYRQNFAPRFQRGVHKIECMTKPLQLFSGEYALSVGLVGDGVRIDYLDNVQTVNMRLPKRAGSTYEYHKNTHGYTHYVEHEWSSETIP
ncbi:ABC transporter ATP-binding protein [Halodesulfovibrio sp.]|uniref:ABC transporter ATP-binding protein n=1 Tax=Halodesulfovibrio sp. TaxID=1912772 RepID=UPI0025B7E55F|nr:ABC transporter ATP-binding protein [Halodesulfovibrio sp.]